MSDSVFVVSEWRPKEGCDEKLWDQFKQLMALSRKESGCIRAHVTKQIPHPGAPTKSKYMIALLQEYVDIKAFDIHCTKEYVKNFFRDFIENEETALVEDWQCKLFSENK